MAQLKYWDGSAWKAIGSQVDSVAGRTGDVVLSKADVGLSNVDNTSDAAKPISTATQTALNAKAASSHNHSAANITSGTLAVARGGTGQTTLALARNAMGLGNTTGALPIANGGTGGTTAATARSNLGLGSVNNTADSAKPVSTAQQTALNLKANIASPTFTGTATAPSNTAYTTRQIRNIVLSTAAPSGGSNGDVWLKYV